MKQPPRIIKIFSKFTIAGIICALINLFVLFFLTEFLHVYYLISAVISFIVGTSTNFTINKTWTFREKFNHRLFTKSLKFLIINLFTLMINIALLFFLTEFFHIYYLISQIFAMGITGILNFLCHKKLTFSYQ